MTMASMYRQKDQLKVIMSPFVTRSKSYFINPKRLKTQGSMKTFFVDYFLKLYLATI